MKHWFGKILQLALALMTVSVLATTAFAAETDRLIVDGSPLGSNIVLNSSEETPFYVIPTILDADDKDVTGEYYLTYTWLLDDFRVSTTNYYEFPANMEIGTYTLTCMVTATHFRDGTTKTAQVTWTPTVKYTEDISLTINENVGKFSFTSYDTMSGSSVYRELVKILELNSSSNLDSYVLTIGSKYSKIATLSGNGSYVLSKLGEVYLTITGSGTWTVPYSVTQGEKELVSGKLSIVIESGINIDMILTAAPGETVVIDSAEFLKFWNASSASYATLQTITITSQTATNSVNGVLCYDHTANEQRHTNARGLAMYVSPKGTAQKALKDLTFEPSKVSNKYPSGAVTIEFTASGIDKNKKAVTVEGSIVIFYTNEKVDEISYNCDTAYAMFDSYDFIYAYRAFTGSKEKNPNFSIMFLDLPVYGTLYRNYSSDFYGAVNSTALTSANRTTMTFSSVSTGANSIDKLAYIPNISAAKGETLRYLAYSGSKLLYIGTVTISSKELVITYNMTGSQQDLSSTDFYTGDSPLLYAQYIVFGNPSSGTLYKNYANGSGTPVRGGEYFSYQTAPGISLLDSLTYVPQAGFTGIVEIPFVGQSLTNTSVSGKVRIYVVAKQFEDVDPNNWAAPYINRLYASGIVSGTSTTAHTFSPDSNMTYGAALKMIMIAAGYPKQVEPTDAHWASKYLDLAYKKGIVSTKNIDLNAAVDRNTVAEIAAKALGLSKASSVDSGIVAPVDSTNGYVYALYNAGIINGSFHDGRNYFFGDKMITRAEVAKIICMINDYAK